MADVTTVREVDLRRYLGRWYEICRLPLRWEDETATDITADYSLTPTGRVRIDNRCFDATGKPSQAVGEATPVDTSNARLKVTFLPAYLRWLPVGRADYWILELDPDYRTALVGSPDRKYLWVLNRMPAIASATLQDYLAEARQQGFELGGLITPRHTNREVTDVMLGGT